MKTTMTFKKAGWKCPSCGRWVRTEIAKRCTKCAKAKASPTKAEDLAHAREMRSVVVLNSASMPYRDYLAITEAAAAEAAAEAA